MKILEMKIAPNPRRVRLFLAEKGIPMTYEEVDLSKGENRRAEFRAKNPFGLVPVLEFDDGSTLSESVAICRYFEEVQPEPPLFGRTAREKAEVEMWNRRIELYFLLPVGMCFQHTSDYFKAFKPQVPAWGELCRTRALEFFDLLDAHLAHQPWIAGEAFSIADITAVCTIDFAKVNGQRIQAHQTHLRRWHDAMSERTSYRA